MQQWRTRARASARQDHERFAALVTQRNLVRSYVRRHVANPTIADDLVSDTYVVAWRRLDEVPEDEQAIAWLCAVARNLVRNYVRAEARRRRLVERLRSSVETRPRNTAAAVPGPDVERIIAAEAWAQLSWTDRQLLAWAVAGWSHEEIAAELDIRIGTVAMRLMRARNRLADTAAI
jgi:RNA polymerase sigma-70 factor (ECF subfamily)